MATPATGGVSGVASTFGAAAGAAVLSCVAAIQAPLIMMSQNRQETKDRERAENDYNVNLKSELIVGDLHMKLDSILDNQDKIRQELDELRGELRKKA